MNVENENTFRNDTVVSVWNIQSLHCFLLFVAWFRRFRLRLNRLSIHQRSSFGKCCYKYIDINTFVFFPRANDQFSLIRCNDPTLAHFSYRVKISFFIFKTGTRVKLLNASIVYTIFSTAFSWSLNMKKKVFCNLILLCLI